MKFDRDEIVEASREYERYEPLYDVERDRLETLPEAFAERAVVWKDVEWIVRWYYRRYLGDVPHERRQAVEDRFLENDWDDVRGAVERAVSADDPEEKVEHLLPLDGVSVPIASAVLQFADPGEYVVVDGRAWTVLYEADELGGPYPDPPSTADYVTYRGRCLDLAEALDVDLQTLYRALWRFAKEE